MRRTTRAFLGLTASLALAIGVLLPGGEASADTANGTWAAYPGSATLHETSVHGSINADGTSNFKANGKGVIPVQFRLASGVGPFLFQSIGSDTDTDNDYSFVSFTPTTPVTFADITELSAVYDFTTGDNGGGSMRWSVRLGPNQSVFVYYGDMPNLDGDPTQSGVNLLDATDLRFDTSQLPGGTFYDSYAHAVELAGSTPIVRASLVVDSGWAGNQVVDLASATFATAGYSDTFTPPAASAPTPTCPSEPATILVTKLTGATTGQVNEPVSIQPRDDDGFFRIVDCRYQYNLATSSLSGAGRYEVQVVIDGVPAAGSAFFDLR